MIQVEHLTKTYGKFTAVNSVSFTVQQGGVYALLGPNGSGKTTTLKSILGLNIPTSGRVLVNGLDTQEHPKATRQLLSYLPQRVVFPENQTAREILMFYCRVRKLPLERAADVLEKARFNGFSDKPVGEFSGGMVQRLGLAVLALANAQILVLDEPTANLDPQGVKRFREFILGQKEMGKTVIFSTHLLAEAEQLADRVGIFLGGKLVADETVENFQRASSENETIEDLYLHYVGNRENE